MKRNQQTGLGIGVMVLNERGEILLGWHETHGRKGWGFPGGEVDLGEDPLQTARRELLEETGIESIDFKIISVSRDRLRTGRWVTLGVLCKDYSGEARVLEPHKISRWKWFPLEAPPKKLFIPARKMIKNYKAGQLYGA